MNVYVVLDLEKLKKKENPLEALFIDKGVAETYVKDHEEYEFEIFDCKTEDELPPVRRGRKPGAVKKVVGPLYKCLHFPKEEAKLTVGAVYVGKEDDNGEVTVTDNENEEVVCPKEWFVKLR